MRAPASPVERQSLGPFLQLGVSLALATRDDRRVVEIVRCVAARLHDDGKVLIAIPLPEGKRTLANIDSTGVVALSAALPSNYSTVQLKGTDAKRIVWPEQQLAIAQHRERFTDMMRLIGLGEAFARSLFSAGESAAVCFTPDQQFDQTPGPAAGLALAP
jgi:hypothetical protein